MPNIVPAFTLFNFSDGKPNAWAITVNDYEPEADSVSTIVTFNTKEEAEEFISASRPVMTAPGGTPAEQRSEGTMSEEHSDIEEAEAWVELLGLRIAPFDPDPACPICNGAGFVEDGRCECTNWSVYAELRRTKGLTMEQALAAATGRTEE